MKAQRARTAAFYLALLAMAGLIAAAPALSAGLGGFGPEGIRALAILVFAVGSWCFGLAPIAVTALIVLTAIPFAGLMSFSEVITASFGDSTFAFFLGVLLLSAAFQKTALGRVLTLLLFRAFGKRPRALVLGILLAGAALAMWVTEVASAAILFPIVLSVVEQTRSRPDHRRLGRVLMMSVAWGPAFGGVATPIATGANLIAVRYLEQQAGITIRFGQWMCIGVPIMLSLLVVGWLLLSRGIQDNSPLILEDEMPPMGRREWTLLIVFLGAIVLWVAGDRLGLSSHHVALLAAVALFLPGLEVLDWKDAVRSISWDSIILICSGIVIGDLLYQYGLAETLAGLAFFRPLLRVNGFVTAFYIVLTISVLKVLFSSNTVTGVILVPIMIRLAGEMGASAWSFVAPCIFSSALSFIVITSSPVNVIPYSAGYFTPGEMARQGVGMTLAAAAVIAVWLMVFGVMG